MKLFEVPRSTTVVIVDDDIVIAPHSTPVSKGEAIKFHHCDGMYSYCHNLRGEVVHLAAWTKIEIWEK